MSNAFAEFPRQHLKLSSLNERIHDLNMKALLDLDHIDKPRREFYEIASKIRQARKHNASVILMIGAHVIRAGVQKFIIDLMQKGHLTLIAMNGAGVIHDYEFASIGATTESVAHYIKDGRFGFWKETGYINDIVSRAAEERMGLGQAVGQAIEKENFPYRDISILAAGYRLNIPVTVHVGIGYDIVHQYSNCDGAAYGATSYRDFLYFANELGRLEGGVVMNFGSAVMAPEVFLKALSMARNLARQKGERISKFSTLVCDLVSLPGDYHCEVPRSHPQYFFRPWKTMLVRTVAEGGVSYYVQGDHVQTVPQLWAAICAMETENG